MRKRQRVFVGTDIHGGHRVGLTHPQFEKISAGDKYYKIRRELWDYFAMSVKAAGPFDIALWVGDMTDGKGQASGASELFESSWSGQRDIARAVVEEVGAKQNVMVFGTPYHTGKDTDHERTLARELGTTIRSQEWVDINGTIFDMKHKVGGSTIPHGRQSAIAKEHLWNQMWAEHDEQPKSDVILRGHVHFYAFAGGNDWLGMTLPALQGQGSKYGARQCSGIVDFGFIVFDCFPNGGFTWTPHILRAVSQKRVARKL
jgi:hypothetical protein